MIFGRKKNRSPEPTESATGGTAVADRGSIPELNGFADTDAVLAEVRELMAANRESGDRDRERRILELRHLAGSRHLHEASGDPVFPEPDRAALPETPLAEVGPDELTPELLRAGILRDGAVLVRGAVTPEAAEALANGIEQAFRDRAAHNEGDAPADSIYEEFQPQHGPDLIERNWIEVGGGVLAADSPRLSFEMLDAFERVGLDRVISGYLGEPAAVSAQKCTLRKAEPSVQGNWHQDGNFMGDVRALNVWLSLSRCGDVAPGLDVVPKRLDYLVESGTDGAPLDYVVAPSKVEEAAGDAGVVRPIFEPGDIMLFDDLFLHQTGSDPSMPNPRYAIECWFFGASGFPTEYTPIAA